MQIPNLTLAYQVLSLKPLLEGAFLNKVQRVSDKVFKFKFHTKQGSKDLIFNGAMVYFTSYKFDAEPGSHGFAAYLKKQLYNKRVESVYQQGFDRVVVLEFTAFNLVFELFADSNMVLADKSWNTLSALTYGEWKDRVIKRNQAYQFPSSKGLNPACLNANQLKEQLAGPDLVRALISNVNIAPMFAEEALALAGLSKSAKLPDLTGRQWETLAETIQGFYAKPATERLQPVYYSEQQLLLPFPLSSLKAAPKPFASLDEAFDALFSEAHLSKETTQKTAQASAKISKDQFHLGQQLEAQKQFQQAFLENQRKAEAIYTHYRQLEDLLKAVREADRKGISQKEILEKLGGAFKEGRTTVQVVDLDLRKRRLTLDLK